MKYKSIAHLERALLRRYETVARSGRYKMDPKMDEYGVTVKDGVVIRDTGQVCGLCLIGAWAIGRRTVSNNTIGVLIDTIGITDEAASAFSDGTCNDGVYIHTAEQREWYGYGVEVAGKARRILARIQAEKQRKTRRQVTA